MHFGGQKNTPNTRIKAKIKRQKKKKVDNGLLFIRQITSAYFLSAARTISCLSKSTLSIVVQMNVVGVALGHKIKMDRRIRDQNQMDQRSVNPMKFLLSVSPS